MITDIGNRYGIAPVQAVPGATTIDCANAVADTIRCNVTAAALLTLRNAMAGQRLLLLLVASTATGLPFAITFPSNVKLSGTVSLAANGSGLGLTFYYDGKNYLEVGRSAAAVAMPAE